jgi:hypothetical protein
MMAKTTRAPLLAWIAATTLGLAVQAFAQPPNPHTAPHPLPYQSKDKNLGTVTCASSLCHGSIIEWKGSSVLQNEYVTWSRVDKHANKAYQILFNDRSKRIVQNLGLKRPAHEEKICLDCHSYNVPKEVQGERFKFADGISCEACHGPAERYVKAHIEPGATHAKNIANGLYPLSDPTARAKLCLSCHWGNQDKFVTHRIMGAGHPRMSFELETFSMSAPAHFRIDKDYEDRKGQWDGVKVWAIGQALAVSEMMDILVDPKRGRDGIFPELTLFDCHACHHPMSDLRWRPKTAFGASPGPGVARLNDANMLMLRAIARSMDRDLGQRVNDQVFRLHQAAAGNGDPQAEAAAMKKLAIDVSKRIEAYAFTEAALKGVALALVDEGLNGNYSDYAAAEQATMALGSVINFLHKRGYTGNAATLNRSLERLRATLANDEKYKAGEFQDRLKDVRVLIAGK